MNEAVPLDRTKPVTAKQAISWFVEATSNDFYRMKKPISPPTAADVAPLVKLINAHRQWRDDCRHRDPSDRKRDSAIMARLRLIQKAFRTLKDNVPPVLELYRAAGPSYFVENGVPVARRHPSEVALERVLEAVDTAVQAAPAYLSEPPKGRPIETNHMLFDSLAEPVRKVLIRMGVNEPSITKPGSPGAKVLRRAMSAITDTEPESSALRSAVRRIRKTRKSGSG